MKKILLFLFVCISIFNVFANGNKKSKEKLKQITVVIKNATNKPLTNGTYYNRITKKTITVTNENSFTINVIKGSKTPLMFMAEGYSVIVLKPAHFTKKRNTITVCLFKKGQKFDKSILKK